MNRRHPSLKTALASIASVLLATGISAHALAGDKGEANKQPRKETECQLEFSLSSWSAFYKSSTGEGTISCDNGQSASVTIRAHGGGLTFGKSTIHDGYGVFSRVYDLKELFGAYASAEAHAGATTSVGANAMTKGEVSLALSGKGKGIDLGFAFGKFTIKPK
jgi:hypothetical protein